MKKEIVDAFNAVTMPQDCQRKIIASFTEERKSKMNFARRLGTAAAALAVVLLMTVTLSTEARAAVNDLVQYVFGGASFITMDTETGEILEVVSHPTHTDNAVFVEAGDGKMYFSANGQYIDITDKTSMETPYIYTYVDEQNIEHMLIIGGVPDNFGVSEFYREVVEGQQDWQGWIGGYSDNYLDNETGKAYPWLAAAWEELDLLWPMPGT